VPSLFDTLLLLAEQTLKERLIYLISEYSYLGVFLFLIACGLGFPVPEEVSLVGGGYAIYLDDPNSWPKVILMVAVAMTGVLTGDVMLYFIGRRVGERPEKVPIIGRHLNEKRMRRARAMFRKHGAKAVFFGRFLFGIRAVTFFVSGSMRVPLVTFIVMDGLAALLTVPASVILAWWFGGSLNQAFEYIGRLDRAVLLFVGASVVVIGITWLRRRKLEALDEELEAIEDSQAELLPVGSASGAPAKEALAKADEPGQAPEPEEREPLLE
jgi:membrane protein DedA with SNARE-associated domain